MTKCDILLAASVEILSVSTELIGEWALFIIFAGANLCLTNHSNIMDYRDFVAVDFELYTRVATSVCAVGMVRVRDGHIAQKFYSLVNPVEDLYTAEAPNTWLHGITADMVKNAPTFKEIYPVIESFMDGLPMMCHNATTEVRVLSALREHLKLPVLNVSDTVDTYEITRCSLKEACSLYDIPEGTHHDALDDAIACAKVYLRSCNSDLRVPVTSEKSARKKSKEDAFREFCAARRINPDLLLTPDLSTVEDKSTPFFGKKVVITGIFDAYPDRNRVAGRISKLGGDINTTISSRTHIVVVGHSAGPSKLAKIEALKEKGVAIHVMYEDELKGILGEI